MKTAFPPLQLNADIYENDPQLENIRKDRGYSFMDIITVHKDKLPNYEEKVIVYSYVKQLSSGLNYQANHLKDIGNTNTTTVSMDESLRFC